MAGTNAYAVKKALFDRLETASGTADSDLYQVQVDYAWNGQAERERIYLGPVQIEQEFAALGRAGGRVSRDEWAVVSVFIEVMRPGATVQETDERAQELGTVLEELVAANPTLDDVSGVQYGGVAGGELDYELTDDAVASVLELRLRFRSRLR